MSQPQSLPANIVEFTLVDADGAPHEYMLVKHGATEGQVITWSLIAFGGEPLGALAQSIFSGSGQASIGSMMDDPKALASINWGNLGRDIAASVQGTDMAGLTRKLLINVHRDGKSLRDPSHFDAAFQANYGELMKLLWEVVKHNRFLGL